MEHIVQFAVSIDDDAIQKKMEESGYHDICKMFVEKMEKQVSMSYRKTGYPRGLDWNALAIDAVNKFAEEHKQEIIDTAASQLVETFKRTKVFKESMTKAISEKLEG